MTLEDRPKSHAEFMALPEGGGFGMWKHQYTADEIARGWMLIGGKRVEVDGRAKYISIPVEPDTVAFFNEPNDLMIIWDRSGEEDRCWTLGRYADGTWFRREVL